MYGNQHVWRGSRQSIQTLAVMSLIALAACVPRSGDILRISNEVGKVSKNVQALVEAETGSYGRSLRLIYGRELLERDVVSYAPDHATDTENQSASKLFAHFACAGIPIDSNDADLAQTLAGQNKALAAFHSVLEKAAKRAEKDAKGVEAVSTSFQKIVMKYLKKKPLEAYSHSEAPSAPTISFGKPGLGSESFSELYSQCFEFAKLAYELKASEDEDASRLEPYSFSAISTIVIVEGLKIFSEFVVEGVRDSALISEVRAYLDQNEWKIREGLVVNASGTTKLEFDEIENAGGDAYQAAAYAAAVQVYNAELLPTSEAEPDKVEKAFGDLEKAAAALLKSSTEKAKIAKTESTKDKIAEEIKGIVEAHEENKARHAANFVTVLYLAACKAASDCEQKVYNKGISNNHFLLNAMMTRRGAALMVPAIRFDHLLRFDEIAANDKATLVVGLHDSFAEFDTLRGTGLARKVLKNKLVRISTGMSANIRELRKLTEFAAYSNLDGDEIVNALRRLAGNLAKQYVSYLEEVATDKDRPGSKPN